MKAEKIHPLLLTMAAVTLIYRAQRDTGGETFQFDDAGRVYAAMACYGISE